MEQFNSRPCFTVSRALEIGPTTCDKQTAKVLEVQREFEVDEASVIVSKGRTRYRLPKGNTAYDSPFSFGQPRAVREVESERNLANIHGTFYEIPRTNHKVDPDWERMRPVSSHRKQIHDFCTWQGLLVLSGVRRDAKQDGHVFRGAKGGAIWCGAIDDLWQFGKPVGTGGPWKETAVKANHPSDAYLMTGYDCKTLTLTANKDVTVTIEVNVDHQSGWHRYKRMAVKAGEATTYRFPKAFSAHWIRFTTNLDCTATAWLVYE